IAKYLAEERKDEILRYDRGSADAATVATPSPVKEDTKSLDAPTTFAIRKDWAPAALDGGEVLSPRHRFLNEPIAIVGMSGVMPLSEDLDEFWDNLKNAKDLISVVPPDRWRWEDYFGDPLTESNKTSSRWGGFMKEVDKFDAPFFGISAR